MTDLLINFRVNFMEDIIDSTEYVDHIIVGKRENYRQ